MKNYYMKIENNSDGVFGMSLVEHPAVEENFICLSKNEEIKLSAHDETKHIITGVALLADTPIYRRNANGEYNIIFEKETVRQIVEKFAKDDNFKIVNLQHDNEQYVDGIYMFESYLVNKERGIAPKEFPNVTDGSWIVSYKVENEKLWDKIINNNNLNGFSIEGRFNHVEAKMAKEEETFVDWINKQLEK